MSNMKPVITLAAIVALISALIIVVYELTYVDTSGILTEKQANAAVEIYGGVAEDYSVVPAEVWTAELSPESDKELARITKIIQKNDGSLLFESVVKGYKDGFDIMVGVKDGAVSGVAIVSMGEETPGLGTKTNTPEFLGEFAGATEEVVIVKKAPSVDNEVQAVSSATFSSKGVAQAVNIALKAYEKCGGDF